MVYFAMFVRIGALWWPDDKNITFVRHIGMATKFYSFVLILVLAFLGGISDGSGNPDRIEKPKLLALIDHLRKEVGAPGAILGVHSGKGHSEIVACGFADRETKKLIKSDSPYFLGSISKMYTAVTALRLVEKGLLSLDDTLDHFLPSFPDGSKITIRHLLGQTSGLKDFYLYFYYRPDRKEMIEMVTKNWSKEELIGLSGRFGRWFEPGTDWDYSSTNYYLLGVIIEQVSGLSLPEAYRVYIYQPLGIKQTWLLWHEKAKSSLPTGYLGWVQGWKHSEMFGELGPTTVLDRSPAEWGAGGVAAPAGEAIQFLRGLLDGKLLAPASLESMKQFHSTPQLGVSDPKTPPDQSDGYGLGLMKMERGGLTILGHGGLFTGHTAGLWSISECDVTIALYFNRGFVNQRAVLDQIFPVVCGKQRQ